jgi:hypothetical protein
MASTYSNLKIQLMATGENSTTWGDITNVNIGAALGSAIASSKTITYANASQTLTWTDTNAPQDARFLRLNLTGTATAGYNLVVPAIGDGKPYIINNGTDGTITVKNATGSGIAVPTGKTMWVYNDGTNVVDAITHLTSLTLGTALSATSGGTGQSSYAVGDLLYASTTTALSKLADVATGNSLISGGVGVAPSWGKIGLTTHVSGTLPTANGGTNLTSFTSGGAVYATSTSVLTTGTLPSTAGGTGLTSFTSGGAVYATSTSALTTGTLPVTSGGTGANTAPAARTALSAAVSGANGDITSLTGLTTALSIAQGGTGANTAAAARTGIGATTVGGNFFTLTNPSAITFPRINADNTVSALDAATFRTAIGSGTVTNVSFTGGVITVATSTTTPAFTVAGTSGGIPYFSSASTWATSAALAANSLVVGGGAGTAPATVTTGTGVVTALGVNTGTAGAFVVNGGALGTPSSGNLTGCTFPTLNQNTTGSAATLTTARTLTIGSTGKTFDGSASVSWSLTEIGAAASGANTDITSLNASTTINSVVIGYRNIPRSTTTTTANVSDVGKCIAVSAGITFPNATFAAGDVISIYNNSTASVTITQGTGFTLYLAGTATTGNRTLAQRGIATIWCNSASDGVISGGGLT